MERKRVYKAPPDCQGSSTLTLPFWDSSESLILILTSSDHGTESVSSGFHVVVFLLPRLVMRDIVLFVHFSLPRGRRKSVRLYVKVNRNTVFEHLDTKAADTSTAAVSLKTYGLDCPQSVDSRENDSFIRKEITTIKVQPLVSKKSGRHPHLWTPSSLDLCPHVPWTSRLAFRSVSGYVFKTERSCKDLLCGTSLHVLLIFCKQRRHLLYAILFGYKIFLDQFITDTKDHLSFSWLHYPLLGSCFENLQQGFFIAQSSRTTKQHTSLFSFRGLQRQSGCPS